MLIFFHHIREMYIPYYPHNSSFYCLLYPSRSTMMQLKGEKDSDTPNPDLLATKFKEAIQQEKDRILMDAALQPYVPPPPAPPKKKVILPVSDEESDDINFDEDDAVLDRIYNDRRSAVCYPPSHTILFVSVILHSFPHKCWLYSLWSIFLNITVIPPLCRL